MFFVASEGGRQTDNREKNTKRETNGVRQKDRGRHTRREGERALKSVSGVVASYLQRKASTGM